MGKNNRKARQAPIAELLEPRMLFSADSLSMLGGALVPDEQVDSNTLSDFYPEIDLSDSNTDNDKVEVVFIDSRVPEFQSIIDDIAVNKSSSVKVVIIDQSESGIEAVKNTLASFDNVDSVHIVSHSFGPSVRLGSDFLSSSTLSDHALSITAWGENLSADADLLIYGCEIGASIDGLNLMDELAALTGADVAVSANDTGHSSLGGDWALEHSTGQIETGALLSAALQNNWEHILAPWDAISNRVLEVTYAGDQFINDTSSIDALIQDAGLSGNEISLREAIAAANNETDPANITIKLSAGTEYILDINDLTIDDDLSHTGDLDITRNLTIEGAGTDPTTGSIINADSSAGQERRVLDTHGDIELNLTGVTISGGRTDDPGAGLRVSGSVIVMNDVHVDGNNSLSSAGGGMYVDNYGSAVTSVTINDSTFMNNNAAQDGGGLFISNGPASELNNVKFINNEALRYGGGLYVDVNVEITDSFFNLNRATDGAGLYVNLNATVKVTHTDFDTNTAFANGGGVYVRGTFSLEENSTLSGNRAESYGGGAYLEGEMSVSESTINDNRAIQNNGGGIHSNAATLTIHDSIISGNRADAGEGGGLSVQGSLALSNSTVANNTAIDGGGINFYNAGNPTIVNSTFFENRATLDGGAIRLNGGYLSIENTTIAKNVAEDTGGAIDVDNGANSSATLFNSIVSENDSQDKRDEDGSGHYQLAEGVVSAGFNVITRDAREQETYFKDVASYNDIIQIDTETYVVDAALSGALKTFNDSHSMHLQLGSNSDAIDAGAGAARLDAYGIMSNEFVDAGAVESHATSTGSKLFWIDKDDYSVYRMNEDGRALQQIMPSPVSVLQQYYLDIAYDDKTRQLFLVRYTPTIISGALVAQNFDVVYGSADGEIIDDSFLSVGGVPIAGTELSTSTYYSTQAIAIEETADPLAPNVLYISLHAFDDNAYSLFAFDIVEGIDSGGTPNIWLAGYTDKTPVLGVDNFVYDAVTTLDITSDPNSAGEVVIAWGDSGGTATEHFHIDKDNPGFTQGVSLNPQPKNIVRGVAYSAVEDATYVASNHTIWKTPFGADPTIQTFARAQPTEFSDIELISNSGIEQLWFVDAGDGSGTGIIGYVNTNLANPSSEIIVEQAPFSLTIATLSSVNTPPRVLVNSPLLVAENASKIIDNTFLSHTATGNVDPAPASNIKYKIDYEQFPQHGTLYLDGAKILKGATPPPIGHFHFTQDDIDTGKLSYTQDGAEAIADSFTFIVSDASLDTTDLTGTFNIDITPVNDAPTITVSNTNLTILESDTGVIFATVVAADIDSPLPTVTVTDGSGNPNLYVEYVNGNIQQKPGVTFDFETMGSFDFVVTAVDDQTATSLPQTFTVTIDDVNEAPSMAPSNPILGSIMENQIGPVVDLNELVLPALVATDPDAGDSLTFSVLDDTGVLSTSFSIDPVTKRLLLDNPLDFENLAGSTNPVQLTIQVTDSFSLTDTHQISVSIKDQNEAPNIANPLSNVSTPELTAFVYPIPLNTFDDQDANTTLSVQVAMADGSALPTWLSYDASNDTLSGTPSDADAGQVIDLVVWATDDATPALSSPLMPLSITVNDINQAPDAVTLTTPDGTLNVPELTDALVIGTLATTDPDAADTTHTYSIVGAANAARFEIIGSQLQLQAGQQFDIDNEQTVSIDIRTTDSTGASFIETFTFDVVNVNEAPSATVPATAQIAENSVGIVVGPINPTDPDAGDTVSVQLVNLDDPASTDFALTANNEIELVNPLNHEVDDIVQLEVTVTDAAGISTAYPVTVSILDVNEAPTITGPSVAQIDENRTGVIVDSAGADMQAFGVIDEDAINTYSYTLLNTVAESILFELDANNQIALLPGTGFDFENPLTPTNTITLTIQVSDQVNVVTHDIDVTVIDVNDAPVALSLTTADGTFDVPELTDALVIGTLATSDPDAADTTHTYSIIGAANTARFEIIGSQLQLQVGQQFDIDNEQTVSIDIRTTDSTGASFIETFTLDVVNVNEAPSATVPATAEIAENSVGIVVGPINPTDPDAGDTVSVQLVNLDDPASTDFALTANNEIELVNPLNHEVDDLVQLEVIVTDAAGISTAYPVTVSILDVNEAPTITGPSVAQIDENSTGVIVDSAGADMQAFGVIDEDAINTYSYTLLNTVAESILFELDANNQIALLPGTGFDFENPLTPTNTITLTIQVSDQVNVVTHDIDVTVIDVNDAPVALSLNTADGTFNVPELTDALVIGTLATSDPDAGDTTHTYSIVGAANAARFEIIGSQLQLQVGQQFDIDNEQSVSIDIRTTDSTGASFIETFTLNVMNVNEAPSATIPATAQIVENSVGIVVGPINATDPDAGDTVSVQLVNLDDPASTDFALTANNEIELVNPLNHEVNDLVQLEVTVTDAAGISTAYPVTVSILDANDAPVALSLTTADGTFNVPELNDALVIGTLATTDPDAADTTHTYSIVGAANAARFEIIGSQLQLQAGQQFDIDNEQTVSIDIRTTDSTGASFIESFTLDVVNVNEAPSATVPAIAQIAENSVGIVVGPINATDPDTGDSVSVQLVNLDNPASTDFVLTANNEIELVNPLNHEVDNLVQLEVTVTDAAGVSTPYLVAVNILDANDAPVALSLTTADGTFNVPELTDALVIGTLATSDPDAADTTHTYSIVGAANAARFEIIGGQLKLQAGQQFDIDNEQTVSIDIRTTDSTGASFIETFTLDVVNVNEAPSATVPATAQIAENSVGIVVGPINATDPDAGDTVSVQLVNLDNPASTDFVLTANNEIELVNPLNHEVDDLVQLEVIVTDAAGVSTPYPVAVNILDENDAPIIANPLSSVSTPELTAFAYPIPLNTFTDQDLNTTLSVQVAMADGSALPTWLSYNATNNTLFGTPSDADAGQVIDLVVWATDDATPALSSPLMPLSISVNDINQTPDAVTLTTADGIFTVPELMAGANIGVLTTTDPDAADTVHTYTVDDQRFEVVNSELKLKATESVVFNVEQQISLIITSTDSSGASISSPIVIDVVDINEAPEQVQLITAPPALDAQAFLYQIPLDAFTDSENDPITITAVTANGEPLPTWLQYDEQSRTFFGTPTDADTNQQIELLVTASDGQLTSQPAATLTINVVDQNQQPISLSLDNNTVPELTPGVVIGNLTTVDPDNRDTQHTYSVDDQRFEIVGEELKLKLTEALDIDNEQQISLMITSTDSSGESISLPFSLDVTDVNEVPIVQSIPDNLSVSIDQPMDFSQILFVDPENDVLTYEVTLASGEPLPSWLEFDSATNLMTVSDAPPNIDSIDLLFIANDGKGGVSVAPIYIAIERAPEPQIAAALPEPEPEPEIVEETVETTLQTVSAIPITENTPVQSEEPIAKDALEIEQDRQAGDINESIDLASLIKPLEKVSFLDLQSESKAINSINREINITQIDRLENNINWLNLSDAFSQPSDIKFTELANEFDRQREELAERAAENKTLIGSSFTLSSGLSVGYLLWLIRGGTLMGSVLSSLPAWRLVDPLPVLGSLGDDLDDDEETLGSMVDNEEQEADLKKPPAQAA